MKIAPSDGGIGYGRDDGSEDDLLHRDDRIIEMRLSAQPLSCIAGGRRLVFPQWPIEGAQLFG